MRRLKVAVDLLLRGSSPSSRRGSIAARTVPRAGDHPTTGRPRRHDGAPLRRPWRAPLRRRALGSSPSSRRGSIAASVESHRSRGPGRRPRRHDGAPLRQRSISRIDPLFPRRPRRHDGAPLRRGAARLSPARRRRSSPSSRRGSIAAGARRSHRCRRWCRPRRHDGAPLRRVHGAHCPRSSEGSSPSSRRGSIAASQTGRPSPRSAGRPRRHDGAPLRRRSTRQSAARNRAVVPVVTTGLHCGVGHLPLTTHLVRPSSPSSRRGSIAACRPRPRWRGADVVPVVTTGLHCGPNDADHSSPPSTRRPRRHDGAPLRHGPRS